MPSRSCAHISSKSSQPRPATESAAEIVSDPAGKMVCSRPRRSLSGKGRRSVPFEPENVEGHIGWRAGATEEVVELRSAGLVGSDHLAVDYGVIDLERERDLIAECIEAVKGIVVARDEAATGLLEIAERAEAVVLEVEQPVGVVERLFS